MAKLCITTYFAKWSLRFVDFGAFWNTLVYIHVCENTKFSEVTFGRVFNEYLGKGLLEGHTWRY